MLPGEQWRPVVAAYDSLEALKAEPAAHSDSDSLVAAEVGLVAVEEALKALGQPVELRWNAQLDALLDNCDRLSVEIRRDFIELRRDLAMLKEETKQLEAEAEANCEDVRPLRDYIRHRIAMGLDPGCLSEEVRTKLSSAPDQMLLSIDELILAEAKLHRLRKDAR